MKGDSRSLDRLLELMRQYCDENATASEQIDEEDAEILADYEQLKHAVAIPAAEALR